MRPGTRQNIDRTSIPWGYRSIWWVWLILIHVALAASLSNSARVRDICESAGICTASEFTNNYHSRREFLRRRVGLIRDEYALVLGDSHIEGLAFELIDPMSINAGIGGDTSFGVLERLSDYEPFDRWRYLVLSVGFNDLKFRTPAEIVDNYEEILERTSRKTTVFVMSQTPIDEGVAASRHEGKNKLIGEANRLLRLTTDRYPNAYFLDIGQDLSDGRGSLLRNLHLGDGVHLNDAGQLLVVCQLRVSLEEHIGDERTVPGYCE